MARISLWLGMVLVFAIGFIHVLDAPDSFHDAAYKGWLFYINGVGSFIAAYGIYRKSSWGWNLGLLIAVGSFIGYMLSRTVGLPQLPAEPDAWFEPLGIASFIAEGLFAVVFIGRRSVEIKKGH